MFRRIPVIVLLAAALVTAGCEEGLPTEASALFDADFSVAPDPGVALPATGVTFIDDDGTVVEFDWVTTLDLIIRTEVDQIGARVISIGASVQEAIEGIAVQPTPDNPVRFRYLPRAETNRIEPGSEVVIRFDVYYTLPGGGGESLVSLNATLASDAGRGLTDAVQVSVLP